MRARPRSGPGKTSRANELDAVVIGAGHNALVAAAYLAKAGWQIEVLERDTVLGGAVSTVERFPGHLVDRGSSAHIMIRHTPILDELDLTAHGLQYLDCDPWAFAPAPPGSGEPPLVFHTDLDATCDSIAAACGSSDADAYRQFVAEWGPRSAAVMRSFTGPPTEHRLVRSFWGLDVPAAGARELSRQFLTSGDALLDATFASERLKAALAWFGAQSGPPMSEPGTAPMVGFAALMHTLPPGRAVGGSGALTAALVRRIEADGTHITAGDPVTQLTRRNNTWVVRTRAGREVHARRVIAGCHILTTLNLLQAGGHDTAQWRRRIRVGPGIGMAVRLATTALPDYGADPALSAHGLQLLVTDRRQLHAAHGAALAGQLPPDPAVLAMSFSALDPGLCPPGEHSLTLWSQWQPYHLAGQDWAAAREPAADAVLAQLIRFSPGFGDHVRDRYVQSPVDLEAELGLVGGNIMHVEMCLDQMFMWRPVPELSGQKVPGLAGLYLAGASMHPGGGVNGSSGRSAARLALADRRRRLR